MRSSYFWLTWRCARSGRCTDRQAVDGGRPERRSGSAQHPADEQQLEDEQCYPRNLEPAPWSEPCTVRFDRITRAIRARSRRGHHPVRRLHSDLIRLAGPGVTADWIRQVQSLGYPKLSVEDAVRLRGQGITQDYIREARRRFKDISINDLIRLKEAGIL